MSFLISKECEAKEEKRSELKHTEQNLLEEQTGGLRTASDFTAPPLHAWRSILAWSITCTSNLRTTISDNGACVNLLGLSQDDWVSGIFLANNSWRSQGQHNRTYAWLCVGDTLEDGQVSWLTFGMWHLDIWLLLLKWARENLVILYHGSFQR